MQGFTLEVEQKKPCGNACGRVKKLNSVTSISVPNIPTGKKSASYRPALCFHGRLSIDLGGVHCVLLQTEAPHERDCVLVHVPEQGFYLPGMRTAGIFTAFDGGYDKAWLKRYLASVEAMEFKLYVPGHGAPERKAETLAALRAELESLEG